MANLVSKNLEKSVTNLVIVGIASAVSIAATAAAKKAGVDIDSVQVNAAVITVLSGLLAGVENWWSHRKEKVQPPAAK